MGHVGEGVWELKGLIMVGKSNFRATLGGVLFILDNPFELYSSRAKYYVLSPFSLIKKYNTKSVFSNNTRRKLGENDFLKSSITRWGGGGEGVKVEKVFIRPSRLLLVRFCLVGTILKMNRGVAYKFRGSPSRFRGVRKSVRKKVRGTLIPS